MGPTTADNRFRFYSVYVFETNLLFLSYKRLSYKDVCVCVHVSVCECVHVCMHICAKQGGETEREGGKEPTVHLCSSIHKARQQQKENICLAIRHSSTKMCRMQDIIILYYITLHYITQ